MNNPYTKSNPLHGKRVLVTRFSTPIFVGAIRSLRDRGFQIVYWESIDADNNTKLKKEFPDTIFHAGYVARLGLPAKEVDITNFPPPGKDLFQKLERCESQVLTMMKVEDPDNKTPIFKKKHLYNKHVKYWYGVLTSLKIDTVISSDIPHWSYWYIVYHLSKLLGIRFLMMRETIIAGRYLMLEDIENYKNLRYEIEKNALKNFTTEELSPDLKAYYVKQIDSAIDSTPQKLSVMRRGDFKWRKPQIQSIGKHIKSLTLPKAIYSYMHLYFKYLFSKHSLEEMEPYWYRGYKLQYKAYQRHKIKKKFQKKYKELQSLPDFSKKFIYVPLHLQPECTTSAMGDIFVDQILMIDILSYCLPEGWLLYVKENPLQWDFPKAHAGRFNGYYDEIIQRKNVRLVPIETSTYDLIEKSQAIASVTGTACWEAVLRSKPALLFGYEWFMHCNGILRVSDNQSCKEALKKIRDGFVPDKQKVLNYLAAFDRITFIAFHNKRIKKLYNLGITEEENAKNIADVFYKHLTDNN